MGKRNIMLCLPDELIVRAKQTALEQGLVYKGKGNLSAWVAQLIETKLKENKNVQPITTPGK
jgi:hypothetical protein